MTTRPKYKTALVLSGGGTRGAYEAGVIHYIRTQLPAKLARELQFRIFTGSSVGAINSAFCAATADDPLEQGNQLLRLWKSLRNVDIYRRGPYSVGKLLARIALGTATHLIGVRGFRQEEDSALDFQGLFDTQPFYKMLKRTFRFAHISTNIKAGLVDALAVAATNMHTGDLELFLQKSPELRHSSRIPIRNVKITPRHVMASAAIPILFPPVAIHNTFYNDGGLRLNTPLAPAVSLGASRILLVGTGFQSERADETTRARLGVSTRPSLGELLGKLFNAALADRVDFDWDQLERINRVLAACEEHASPDAYRKICLQARVQPIETLALFPSVEISTLVDETIRGSYKRLKTFGTLERFILRLLETGPGQGATLLSYFLFEPTYLQKLVDLGFEDARAKHDELTEFAERSVSDAPME